MTHVEGMIFDLDGTLLNTIDDLTDAMNTALTEQGYPPRSVHACKHFVGDGVEMFVRRALPEAARDAVTIARLVPRYRELYAGMWDIKTAPYPGIVDLLARLTEADVPLGVFSNKPDSVTKQAVAHFLPDVPFIDVRGALPNVPLKPDPAGALAVAAALGADPRHVCFVGDTRTDIETAVAAGMVPVGVLWGFRDADELAAHGARHLVTRPDEILTCCFNTQSTAAAGDESFSPVA